MTDFVGRFLAFWSEFLIGDDWALAAGIVVVLALARVASIHEGALREHAWMIAPIGAVLTLGLSLGRAAKLASRTRPVREAQRAVPRLLRSGR